MIGDSGEASPRSADFTTPRAFTGPMGPTGTGGTMGGQRPLERTSERQVVSD